VLEPGGKPIKFGRGEANDLVIHDPSAFVSSSHGQIEFRGRAVEVVDTSRNGAGPVSGTEVDGGPAWCNPPGRRLGQAPTSDTGEPRVDAFLWVKRPGESDGACRPGEPEAGRWWPEYALDIAKRS